MSIRMASGSAALERVETIDALPENLYYGIEVCSLPFVSAETSSVQFDTVFHPERHYLDQSGIAPT